MLRTPVATLAAAVLAATLLVSSAPAPAATPASATRAAPMVSDPVDAPVPVIAWTACDEEMSEGAECATVPVPLDYDEPLGESIDLDLLRMPATDPGQRIGSLFVNPGGPGGSSRGFAAVFAQFVPAEVAERFDIIGIDPRGVGPSAPALCRSQERRPAYPSAFFPTTRHQAKRQIAYDTWQARACAERPDPVVEHMSTADVARDMDLIRQAVGDPRLTFYGVSYGTQLGATYAAMFPDQVRAIIADGVLDPVAWSTGDGDGETRPFSERLGSGYGAWQALTNAFAECDRVGPRRCPIAGRSSEVWLDIVKRLRKRPVTTKRNGELTYDTVVAIASMMLYDQFGTRFLMEDLRRLHRDIFKRGVVSDVSARTWVERIDGDERDLPGPYAPAWAAGPGYAKIYNSFAGTACADSDNPDRPRSWIAAGKRADRASPWFGRFWTWASSVCAKWPTATQEDRFTGPYAATPAAPVLVVGNSFDPATPLHGARALNRLLDGSRLLVLDGWGHGALGSGPCITEAYGAYLVDGTLPPAGTVCKPATPLFPKRG